jgi:serine protease Do
MRMTAVLWAALAAAPAPVGQPGPGPDPVEAARPRDAACALPDLAPVARAVLPAVVGIVTLPPSSASRAGGADTVQDLFGGGARGEGQRGLATGFVIDADGWIVTNAHVLDDAGRIEVDLGEEGGRVPATVAGVDAPTDLALVKVDAGHPLPVVPLGDSDRLQIADWVLVFGNPFGLSQSVTAGIVSQKGRADVTPQGKDGYYEFLQTDASINPGNSGGPLVNLRGEVVGIATAINATGQGIGFAIPVNMAKDVLAQLRERGRVVRSWMGVSVRELPREAGQRATARGVVVTTVEEGGPAAAAGLVAGDVITAFDGREVPSAARLRWYVASAGVGRRVALSVRRGEAVRAIQVRLADLPGGEARAVSRAPARPAQRE